MENMPTMSDLIEHYYYYMYIAWGTKNYFFATSCTICMLCDYVYKKNCQKFFTF